MSGRFEGLSEMEWLLFQDLFPEPERRGRGMPHAPYRKVLNTLLYVLMTGSRWCDVPEGDQWASKSSAHRWLKRWQQEGTLRQLQDRILDLAQETGLIQWDYGAVDGSFSPWEGRR
jgi:transposase